MCTTFSMLYPKTQWPGVESVARSSTLTTMLPSCLMSLSQYCSWKWWKHHFFKWCQAGSTGSDDIVTSYALCVTGSGEQHLPNCALLVVFFKISYQIVHQIVNCSVHTSDVVYCTKYLWHSRMIIAQLVQQKIRSRKCYSELSDRASACFKHDLTKLGIANKCPNFG